MTYEEANQVLDFLVWAKERNYIKLTKRAADLANEYQDWLDREGD